MGNPKSYRQGTWLLLLLIVLHGYVVPVKADYRLEVTVHAYSNPEGVNSTGYCCDSENSRPPNCDRQDSCDTGFTFCLRNLGTQHDGNSINCPLGRRETRDSVGDDHINFDGRSYIENPGVPNPLVFTGAEWPGGVQLYVKIEDVDSDTHSNDQLIDDVYINASLTPGHSPHQRSYQGHFNHVSISLTFNVTCTGLNDGPNCNHSANELCDRLTNPMNGFVNQPTTIAEGSVATYECRNCYRLYGVNKRTCYSGMWTNSEPTCVYNGCNSNSQGRDTPDGHHGNNNDGFFSLLATPFIIAVVVVLCCCYFCGFCSNTEPQTETWVPARVRVS